MADSGISAGEAGGVLAGVLASLGLVGGGIKWAAGWNERRAMSRATKLQKWHEELDEREHHLDAGRTAYTQTLEQKIATQEAELGLLRHRVNNFDAMWDSVILLLELAPERVGDIVAQLKAKRAEQKMGEAAEKGAIRGAAIGAAGASVIDHGPPSA
jgi:hypothetical protein